MGFKDNFTNELQSKMQGLTKTFKEAEANITNYKARSKEATAATNEISEIIKKIKGLEKYDPEYIKTELKELEDIKEKAEAKAKEFILLAENQQEKYNNARAEYDSIYHGIITLRNIEPATLAERVNNI